MIGWSEQNSTPPAMATSAWPVWIRLMHEVTAWFAEMHAIVTVWPGVDKGNPGKEYKEGSRWQPAVKAASLAMLDVRTSC